MDGPLVDNTPAHIRAFSIFCDRYGVTDWAEKLSGVYGMGNDDIMGRILPEEVIREKGLAALAAAWRNRPAHRNCQKKGGETLFERYSITVASVVRGYTRDERAQAPQDSEKALRRK